MAATKTHVTDADVILTVECDFDRGEAIPFATVMQHCGCSPDQITRLIKSGQLKAGPMAPIFVDGTTFRHPLHRMTVKPEWA